MHLRWQSRRLKRTDGDTSWSPIIVESRRINGKPTQRYVAYLGGYVESESALLARRIEFWGAVDRRLHQLNLSPDDHKKIEAAITLKIRRPTAAER
jgi:hypothetical protein